MILVVYDLGYEGYSTDEFDSMDLAIEHMNVHNTEVYAVYEVSREYSREELSVLKREYSNRRENLKANALAKLSPEEREILGL